MFFFYLVILLLIPGSMTVLGYIYRKNPPKEINAVSGYRTDMSMKNRETWRFANMFWGKLCFYGGIPLVILSELVLILFKSSSLDTMSNAVLIIVGIQIVVFVLTLIPTEMALHRNFEKNGCKKRSGGNTHD